MNDAFSDLNLSNNKMSPRQPNEGDGGVNAVVRGSKDVRGTKRPRADLECTDSCDCDEFGAPLAKRINNLNIQQATEQASVESQSANQSNPLMTPFDKSYPFPSNSPYYSSNKILRDLYLARVERNPEVVHYPT